MKIGEIIEDYNKIKGGYANNFRYAFNLLPLTVDITNTKIIKKHYHANLLKMNYSQNTQARIYSCLKLFFIYCIEKDYIKEIPVTPTKYEKLPLKFYTKEQLLFIIKNTPQTILKEMLYLLYYTGCKPSEIYSITCESDGINVYNSEQKLRFLEFDKFPDLKKYIENLNKTNYLKTIQSENYNQYKGKFIRLLKKIDMYEQNMLFTSIRNLRQIELFERFGEDNIEFVAEILGNTVKTQYYLYKNYKERHVKL